MVYNAQQIREMLSEAVAKVKEAGELFGEIEDSFVSEGMRGTAREVAQFRLGCNSVINRVNENFIL